MTQATDKSIGGLSTVSEGDFHNHMVRAPQQGGRHGAGKVTESFCLIPQVGGKQRNSGPGVGF